MIRRFASKPYFLTMARNFHRQKLLHRDYSLSPCGLGVSSEIARCAKCFRQEAKKRQQTKRHRTDGIGDNTRKKEKYYNKTITDRRVNESFQWWKDRRRQEKFENSRSWPKSLKKEIKAMLKTEEYHVIYFEDITNVEWCPKFVKPEIHGHVGGGKDLRHHRCHDCGRLCFHLLGPPGSKRQ